MRLEMTAAQKEQYDWVDETLRTLAREARERQDYGLTAVWLQNVLCRPNSGFREERVVRGVGKGRHRITVPVEARTDETEARPIILTPVAGEGDLLPKERWLVDFCRSEAAQRRKVIVYVQHTGVRDIQPRLQGALAQGGLKAVILPDSVQAAAREEWIARCVDDLDVLIVNPGKVETGLDLVKLATAVFYEVEYSLPRWQQALGRLHRLGQAQAVKGVYVAYRGTMEEQALGLMGAKKKAQLLLYGENAYSAIAEEAKDDSGDFLRDLAGRVLAGEDLSDGLAGLVTDTQTTTRAWGSYTQQSVVLNSWDDFARRHGFGSLAEFLQAQRLRARRKAVEVESERQPALW